jgi:hypothetical protein
MHCFTHHDQEAVGICCVCGKGLCPDCAVDLGYAISCRGACEHEAQERHVRAIRSRAILDNHKRDRILQKRDRILLSALYIAIGLVFMWSGWFDSRFYLLAVLGPICFIFGLVRLVNQRRLSKKIDRNTHE